MILFCHIVYVYVSKISEEKFSGGGHDCGIH